jgi:ubiquinone/menaquinone biosynthesis C-methylase UbiE
MKKNGKISDMKKILLLIIVFHIVNLGSSQNLLSFKKHCGLYFKTIDQLKKQVAEQVKFYDFHKGETVASIGAQCANWEASFAVLSDSINFYLEDIDPASLNTEQVSFAWKYYSQLSGKQISSSFHIVIGSDTTTNLPDQFFDKIIIINSFHEFSDQQKMLADILKKLKPNGILNIDETLAKKSGDVHIQCHKRIYTENELIEILEKNGFKYINGLDMNFRNSKPVRKIFAFKKA